MTTASTTTGHTPYWRALRFYSRSWRERHGADMITLMLDARDHGEDPLSGAARRSLIWSGLRQRFASRPYAWVWIAATLASLGLNEWAGYRNLQIAESRHISGFDTGTLWLKLAWTTTVLFVACLTILTVSLLHRPPLPKPANASTARSWPGWIVFAVGAMSFIGVPLVLGSLVIAVRGYRAGGGLEFQLLAILSAVTFAFQVLVLLPVVNLLLFI
jgi:hypothetical protein